MWYTCIRRRKKGGKDNCAYVFTASQPFATDLINSNRKWFRYEWIWVKNRPIGFLLAKKQPMRNHEYILIFYNKQSIYNPIMEIRDLNKNSQNRYKYNFNSTKGNNKQQGGVIAQRKNNTPNILRFPSTVKYYDSISPNKLIHPTQKPVALMEYLIKTYTDESALVLDPFIGSGSTALACKKLNRNFIGMEIYQEYIDTANGRLNEL